MLVVHGSGGGFDQGMSLGRDLADRGFRVISVSRFGYLRTPLPRDASAEAQADAHACLLDALGVPAVAVVGASAGAPSSLQFALRYPKRTTALALLVPAIYAPRAQGAAPVHTPPGLAFVFETVLKSDFLLWVGIRMARPTLLRTMFATPPELVAAAEEEERLRVQRMFNDILPVSARRLGLLNDAAVTGNVARYALEEISAPTLAISFEDDLFGTFDAARHAAEHIPGARFIGFPEGGHVWVGHHRQVIDAIESFLAEHGEESSSEWQPIDGVES